MEKLKETGLEGEFLQNFQTQIDLEITYLYFSNPFSFFTPRSLALALGREKEVVEKSLKKLKKAGFLKTISQQKKLGTVYYYQPDSKTEKLIESLFEYLLKEER